MQTLYYPNIPQTIGDVVLSKLASLQELKTIYGVRDLYDMIEILEINTYNDALIQTKINKEFSGNGGN